MHKKKIAIFGSTGSIGDSTFRVIDNLPNEFEVIALSSNGNKIDKIRNQCLKYKPKYLILENKSVIKEISQEFIDIKILHTSEGYNVESSEEQLDVVVIATVGIAGLKPSFAMAKCTKIIAIANKEAIIYGGSILLDLFKKHNCKLIPVDSEHNSLYQLLNNRKSEEVKKIILTASGGSFRDYDGDLSKITVQQALNHPKWQMGHKNTIDSANLVNKGIELIEASILFNMPIEQIECIIHPQVIIHAMIEMYDNSILAFLSNPDMALHLANAIRDNNFHIDNIAKSIDFVALKSLDFKEIDNNRFAGVKIARDAAKHGRSHIVAFNSADEILVQAFIDEKISFTEITEFLDSTLNSVTEQKLNTLEEIIDFDFEIKNKIKEQLY